MSEYTPDRYLRIARFDDYVVVGREKDGAFWYIHTHNPDTILARLLTDSKFRARLVNFPEGSHLRREGLVEITLVKEGKKPDTITQENAA
ncbi:hypothetical protein HYX04_04330 [Candidatus Woesearchaeota archaeon]|nr:hypothetical protein [Candidatus Woesearchaeota archaeon]